MVEGVPAEAWKSGGNIQHTGLLNLAGCRLYRVRPFLWQLWETEMGRWVEATKRKSIQSKDAPSNEKRILWGS